VNMAANPFSFLDQGPVLIVGAGPTGLVSSLWLQKFKIPHRIIDIAPKSGLSSRAMIVQARTLEFYNQLGIAERIVEAGAKLDGLVTSTGGKIRGRINYRDGAKGLTRFPFILSLTQDRHEEILIEALKEKGIEVERGVELVDAVESEDSVQCTLNKIDSSTKESFTASYIIGADGARSRVRQIAGVPMEGGTYTQRFFVADVELASELPAGPNLNINLSGTEYCMAIPLDGLKRARLVGFCPANKQNVDEDQAKNFEITFDELEKSVGISAPGIVISNLRWLSSYRVHHRVVKAFRSTYVADSKINSRPRPGRLFLAGDAAHLHSPAGGQGMNTGIGDATNLAWKLAAVHSGVAPLALLDTYQEERLAFAQKLVDTTDFAFTMLTHPGWIGWCARYIIIPYILPLLLKLPGMIIRSFKTGSQLGINYRQSGLSTDGERVGGSVKAGDRLPWVKTDETREEDGDNLSELRKAHWQVHIYGNSDKSTVQTLEDRGIPLRVFTWAAGGSLEADMQKKGLKKDAIYIVRPDGYIGLVCAPKDTRTFERYLDRWEIGTATR
jgi:2-polyprenyl-6-methoxyphenol hydroxylase-like FAD-dependent oxidoreductase